VARLALSGNVGTSQREICRRMVECRPAPVNCTVTLLAVVAEVTGHMIGIRCAVKISCMALIAISVCQLVISIHVARLALSGNVGTSQREVRCRMIKCCRSPIHRRMAFSTIMAEIPCDVIRIRRSIEICCVALIAIGVSQLVVSIHMTCLALGRNVSTCQREVRGVVVECGRSPMHSRVALRTIVAKIPSYVIRIRRSVEISGVALITIVIH